MVVTNENTLTLAGTMINAPQEIAAEPEQRRGQ
jgi:hypothetical protein